MPGGVSDLDSAYAVNGEAIIWTLTVSWPSDPPQPGLCSIVLPDALRDEDLTDSAVLISLVDVVRRSHLKAMRERSEFHLNWAHPETTHGIHQ
jgi:hypothetical protein